MWGSKTKVDVRTITNLITYAYALTRVWTKAKTGVMFAYTKQRMLLLTGIVNVLWDFLIIL